MSNTAARRVVRNILSLIARLRALRAPAYGGVEPYQGRKNTERRCIQMRVDQSVSAQSMSVSKRLIVSGA
jgi:hypothetical protein